MKKGLVIQLVLALLLGSLAAFVPGGSGFARTLTFKVAGEGDDTSASTGYSGYNTNIIYSPYSDGTRKPFWRWQAQIPKGATITGAYLYLKSAGQAADSSPSVMNLQLIDLDSCPDLKATTTFALPVSTAVVPWTLPGAWSSTGGPTANGWYKSADISALVTAYINRPGYRYGNYLGLRGDRASGLWKTAYQYALTQDVAPVLEVSYTGGEAVIQVKMADPESRIDQKIYCSLTNVDPTDKLLTYLDNALVGQKAGPLGENEVVTVDYSKFTAGTHTLKLVVATSAGVVRGTFQRSWKTTHTGIPEVGINKDNAICLRGVPFFPLTPFLSNAGDLHNDPWAAPNDWAGAVNSLHTIGWYAAGHNLTTASDFLTKASAEGLTAVFPGARWDGFNSTQPLYSDTTKMQTYVTTFRNRAGILAWSWQDEPELGGIDRTPPQVVRQWTDIVKRNDTSRPVLINFSGYFITHEDNPNFTDPMKEYFYLYDAPLFGGAMTPVVDIYQIDYYPYEYGNDPSRPWITLEDYLLSLDRTRTWNADLVPVMTFIEVQDIHSASGGLPLGGRPWTPEPTPIEMKNLIWTSIIHGAKGISYFNYFLPLSPENLAVLKSAKNAITKLTPVILSPESSIRAGVELAKPGRVDTMVREDPSTLYLFAASTRAVANTARFTLPSLPAGTGIFVFGEGRTLTAGSGYFEDRFSPLETHIYMIGIPALTGKPPKSPVPSP